MTGTPGTPGPTRAEQHLGDRLAALVDGELGHDARERVLAHLATCQGCKAEADAQRRVKSVFADTAPPPPSAGLLARLQGLPVSAGSDDDTGAGGGSGRPIGASPLAFSYLPDGEAHGSLLDPGRGFPVHRPPEPERGSASRGRRRFAFVAAGAFSVAAFALGGALGPAAPGGSSSASPGGPGTAPLRPTSGVERPAERRNEAGPAVAPVRRGLKGPTASGGPTAAAVSSTGQAPYRVPRLPLANAPGAPYAVMPPPALRAPHLHRPSPAPGTAPLAISPR